MKTAATLLLCIAVLQLRAAEPSLLTLTKTIALPGVKGRFDHFAVDVRSQRVFVAALGNNTIEVLDVSAGTHIKTIAGLHKPTGVLYLAEQNQIGVANGDDGTFKLFDGVSYALMKSIASLDDADNVRFDSRANLIYIGYGSGALAIVDSLVQKQIGTVKLPAHPESFQLERNGQRIFVNLPDAKGVGVVDREKRAVVARWPMGKLEGNFPMSLAEATHRLFVGCRKPPRLVVFDTEAGKQIAAVEISGDTDDLFYDPKRNRIYISCGEGFVDVVEARDHDRYERVARLPTRSGARTSFFSTELDQLFLAVPQRGGQDAEIRIFQPQ